MVVPYDSYYDSRNSLRDEKVDLEKINTYYKNEETLAKGNGNGRKKAAAKKIGPAPKLKKNGKAAKKE